MTVQITEVLKRATQGMTRPFICRGDDKNIYFVKGIGATRQSQVYEWVAGNLGLALGLPIAPFEIVEIPEELIEIEIGLDFQQLGSGPAFGSLKQTITELNYAGIDEIPAQVQSDVLAFDWWIRNSDRNLTAKGGNPNLFWQPEGQKLVIFDHNQAFDSGFIKKEFLRFHAFNNNIFQIVIGDCALRQEYVKRFAKVLENWQSICASIPEEWYYIDKEMTVEADVNIAGMLEILQLYQREEFWVQQ
ncbi:MAG: HipA family kinase [Thiohalomonadales bacterium]